MLVIFGAVSDAAMNNSISAINVSNAFTLNGSTYREGFSARPSPDAISVTFGDLADFFFASSILRSLFIGGDGANFSAAMSVVTIEDADFALYAELGNGLTITNLTFSASGTLLSIIRQIT